MSIQTPRLLPPSPLVGEGAPEGRMRGGATGSRRCWDPPHPAFGHLLPPGEKGRRQGPPSYAYAGASVPIPPSPLVGEGAPKGRMRGGATGSRGGLASNSTQAPRTLAIPPSPLVGEGAPKGRMRGIVIVAGRESTLAPNRVRAAVGGYYVPPHPAFGHLLPPGEKGVPRRPGRGVMLAPNRVRAAVGGYDVPPHPAFGHLLPPGEKGRFRRLALNRINNRGYGEMKP